MWHLNQFCRDIRTAGSADTPWPALPWDGLPAVSQARSCSSGNSRMCSQVFGEGAAAGPRLPCKRTACVHKAKGRMAQRHHERDASVGKAAVHTGHGCGHMLTPATRGPRRPPCSGRSLRPSSPASSLLRLGPRPLSRQLLWVTCGLSAGHLWVIRSLSQVLHIHLYQEDLAQSFYQKAAYLKRLTTTAAQTFPGLSQCQALF